MAVVLGVVRYHHHLSHIVKVLPLHLEWFRIDCVKEETSSSEVVWVAIYAN